jgi:hypothetical protein
MERLEKYARADARIDCFLMFLSLYISLESSFGRFGVSAMDSHTYLRLTSNAMLPENNLNDNAYE